MFHYQLNFAQITSGGIFFVKEILVGEFCIFVARYDPWDYNLILVEKKQL